MGDCFRTRKRNNTGIIKKLLFTLQKPMIKFIVNQATKISVANEYEQKILCNNYDTT